MLPSQYLLPSSGDEGEIAGKVTGTLTGGLNVSHDLSQHVYVLASYRAVVDPFPHIPVSHTSLSGQ